MIFDKKSNKSRWDKYFPFESLNDSVLKYIPAALILYYSVWGNKYFKILKLLDEYGIIDTRKALNYITKNIIKELKTRVIDKNGINTRINELIKQFAKKEQEENKKVEIKIEDNSPEDYDEIELLRSWYKLMEDGIISKEEFETKKKKII